MVCNSTYIGASETLRILLYTNRNKQSGFGHFYRATALADEAWQRGHTVAFAGDAKPLSSSKYYSVHDAQTFHKAVADFNPDWLIVDLPGQLPSYIAEIRAKLCVINGIGHNSGIRPELAISQGFEGEYCAPKYLILRRALARYNKVSRGDRWFVFGGAADELGLLPAFDRAMEDQPAYLLATELTEGLTGWVAKHRIVTGQDDSVLGWIAIARSGCVHLGVTTWELLYFNIPCYVFSRSEYHLKDALEMDKRGWVKAWPGIGLPSDEELREFLLTPFAPPKNVVGLDGAMRVIKLIEQS